jgi:hypothetical protein
MVLYPDAASLEKLRELQGEGVKNEIKKDDDGWHVRLGRPAEIRLRNGTTKALTEPLVWDGSRPLPDGSGFMPWDKSKMIGDSSDVAVKVEVYEHRIPNQPGKKAKAMRWESLRVDNLVPVEGMELYTEEEKKSSGDFASVPKITW